MPSAVDLAKRALVTLISSLARINQCTLQGTRESPDKDVSKAYRTLSRREGWSRVGRSAVPKVREKNGLVRRTRAHLLRKAPRPVV